MKKAKFNILIGIAIISIVAIIIKEIVAPSPEHVNYSSSKTTKSVLKKLTHEITKQGYDKSKISYYIEGTVTNPNSKEYSYVQISFVCYDKEGNNLGTALDNTNYLGANETWKYKAIAFFSSYEIDHCNFKDISVL